MLLSFKSAIIGAALMPFVYFNEDFKGVKSQLLNFVLKYEASTSLGFKSTKFDLSDDGFIRYRKILKNNKQEYFAVKINKVSDIKYLGTIEKGSLILICDSESVICQTYNDPTGNIDSMSNQIILPLKEIDISEFNSFIEDFSLFKKSATLK